MHLFLLIGLVALVLIVVITMWSSDMPGQAAEIDEEETEEVLEEGPDLEPLPPKPEEEYSGGAGDNK